MMIIIIINIMLYYYIQTKIKTSVGLVHLLLNIK